jgi:multicomponent K+:H+ antiporter subunit G
MLNHLNLWVEITLAVLLVVGASFTLLGSIGLARFDDFFMRLHAPTKATTLGAGCVLLTSMGCSWARGQQGVHEVLIALFLFLTSPVSANVLAQAALHLIVPSRAAVPPDQPAP